MTGIRRTTPKSENVEIQFYFKEGENVLPAQQVQAVLNKVPFSTMDFQLGYPVSEKNVLIFVSLIITLSFLFSLLRKYLQGL